MAEIDNEEISSSPEIRELYPGLTDEQLIEAEKNLKAYAVLSLRIYERICADPEAYAEFKRLIKERKEQGNQAPPEVRIP